MQVIQNCAKYDMDLELMPFYSDLLERQSYFQGDAAFKDQTKTTRAARYAGAKELLESHYHHYLSRKQPQQKIVFYHEVKQTAAAANLQQKQGTSEVELGKESTLHEMTAQSADERLVEELTFFARRESPGAPADGVEMYADEEMEVQELQARKPVSLLEVPIHDLKVREAERIRQAEAQEAANAAEKAMREDAGAESDDESAAVNDGSLWVDKYTSQKFFDLLTDELTNRKVMTWLRSWDDVVFPERPKVSLKPPEFAKGGGSRPSGFFGVINNLNTSSKYKPPQSVDEEFNKDNKKVLMLCGPPGTGKSTMARVLARQCGYETQEVNASDVRTGDQLVALIKNSLSTNAHFTKTGAAQSTKPKPVCLILDEIDGALGGGPD